MEPSKELGWHRGRTGASSQLDRGREPRDSVLVAMKENTETSELISQAGLLLPYGSSNEDVVGALGAHACAGRAFTAIPLAAIFLVILLTVIGAATHLGGMLEQEPVETGRTLLHRVTPGLPRMSIASGNGDPCLAKACQQNLVQGDPCKAELDMVAARLEKQFLPRKVPVPQGKLSRWIVVLDGAVKVRRAKDLKSHILGVKRKCTTVWGHRQGAWVRLKDEPGYIKIRFGDVMLLRQLPSYWTLSKGTCAGNGGFPITDMHTCEAAAVFIGLRNITVRRTSYTPSPEGCFVLNGSAAWLSTASGNKGIGASDVRSPICSNGVKSEERCFSEGSPSLFCFSILSVTAPELRLLRVQRTRNASIFGCDEHAVFSSGGQVELAKGEHSIEVLNEGQPPGSPSMNYLIAWQMVMEEGLSRSHDWIVKVDPSAVFLPEQLREFVRLHSMDGDQGALLLSCRQSDGLKSDVEVLSYAAAKLFLDNQVHCRADLPWGRYSEELYIRKCLKRLGVRTVSDDSLEGGQRRLSAHCSTT